MATDLPGNAKYWWIFLLCALLFILLGFYMISVPAVSYMALSLLFGTIILLTGIAEMAHAFSNRHSKRWGWRVFAGAIDLVFGLILVFNLRISMAVLPILMGLWFLIRGISLLSFASVVRHSSWLIAGGILTVIFALLVMFFPAFGAMTIVLWTAMAFIIAGIFTGLLAFRLKDLNDLFKE